MDPVRKTAPVVLTVTAIVALLLGCTTQRQNPGSESVQAPMERFGEDTERSNPADASSPGSELQFSIVTIAASPERRATIPAHILETAVADGVLHYVVIGSGDGGLEGDDIAQDRIVGLLRDPALGISEGNMVPNPLVLELIFRAAEETATQDMVAEAMRSEAGAVALFDERVPDINAPISTLRHDIIGIYVLNGSTLYFEPNYDFRFISSLGMMKLTPDIREYLATTWQDDAATRPDQERQSSTDTVYFFPFRTSLEDWIATPDSPQASFAIGYPSFLVTLFSSLGSFEVRGEYADLIALDADTGVLGISNLSVEALISTVERTAEVTAGYGVTGFIEILPLGGSKIGITVFDISSSEILRESHYSPRHGTEISILLGDAINDIVYAANLGRHFVGRTMEIHDSLARTNDGFLAYLEVLGLLDMSDSGATVHPEQLLATVRRGFEAQPTFYVLELMFIDIVQNMIPTEEYDREVNEIDTLIVPESLEYRTFRRDTLETY